MRMKEPRLPPLAESDWTDEQRDIVATVSAFDDVLNIFRTMVRHPKLLKRWLVFANHILFKSSLPARDREILILRIGWLCRAEYEWAQHVVIAKRIGMTQEEIDRITLGADAPGWNDSDAALIRATDELRSDAHISDQSWQDLRRHYNETQLMDIVFTVGNYNLVSMALNTFGVQLDKGLTGFPRPPTE